MRLVASLLTGAALAACSASDDPVSDRGATAATPVPAAAQAAIPIAFHGVYDRDRGACSAPSEYRLAVTADTLRFHESIGRVRSVSGSGRRVSVAGDWQGEGESWTNTRDLILSPNGGTLTVEGDGASLTRVRCP